MRKCSKCNFENPDDSLFCASCGNTLELVTSNSDVSEELVDVNSMTNDMLTSEKKVDLFPNNETTNEIIEEKTMSNNFNSTTENNNLKLEEPKIFNNNIDTTVINKNNELNNSNELAGSNNYNKVYGKKLSPQKVIVIILIGIIIVAAGVNIISFAASSVKQAKIELIKSDFDALYIQGLNELSTKNGYSLIEFPNEDSTINNRYKYYNKGYFIIYDKDIFAVKITSGNYCISKGYDDAEIHLLLNGPCDDYTVEYKK